jgi:hypothetical protein
MVNSLCGDTAFRSIREKVMKKGARPTKLNSGLSQKICGRLSERIGITAAYDALGRKKMRIFGRNLCVREPTERSRGL